MSKSIRIEMSDELASLVKAQAALEDRNPTAMARLLIRRGLKVSGTGEDKTNEGKSTGEA